MQIVTLVACARDFILYRGALVKAGYIKSEFGYLICNFRIRRRKKREAIKFEFQIGNLSHSDPNGEKIKVSQAL